MQFLDQLVSSMQTHSEHNAVCIDRTFSSYRVLASTVSAIRGALAQTPESEKVIGLVANDDLETYASIIAVWLEGKAYVPINPDTPAERNRSVLEQAGIRILLNSSPDLMFPSEFRNIDTRSLPPAEIRLEPKPTTPDDYAYILFTSGSTGVPKGVPITLANLDGFVTAFDALGLSISHSDRCLQMFELTFDLSVMSYLIPFLKGACVFTVPKNVIKYSYIYELMEEQRLTVSLMVPSMLHFLRPYFDEIDCPEMRYSLFCGEALPLDIADEWSRCLPNARILNVYGPTEDTIFCTSYEFRRDAPNKQYQGVLCIGKAMEGTLTVIVDEQGREVPAGSEGELCLGGVQLTPGYLNNEAKNRETFFQSTYRGADTRLYRTGDLCTADAEGDIFYIGRLDFQIKIQGFRVELSEIEFHAKAYLGKINVIAIAYEHGTGNTELGLVIEGPERPVHELKAYLQSRLPAYMIPAQIRFEDQFPLNVNGKFDRKELKKKFIVHA